MCAYRSVSGSVVHPKYFLFPTACLCYKVFFFLSVSDLPAASLAIVGGLHEAKTSEFSVLVPHHLVHEMYLLSAVHY